MSLKAKHGGNPNSDGVVTDDGVSPKKLQQAGCRKTRHSGGGAGSPPSTQWRRSPPKLRWQPFSKDSNGAPSPRSATRDRGGGPPSARGRERERERPKIRERERGRLVEIGCKGRGKRLARVLLGLGSFYIFNI
ncbi:hypothetical protein KSP39_PZI010272 [Platanthera zijinensis]|uniref:Uncharacterized protein n=1 Tax=Platanthera zijinensis TaxID=2320716 RepID=A0AAP0BJY1_9ASPA